MKIVNKTILPRDKSVSLCSKMSESSHTNGRDAPATPDRSADIDHLIDHHPFFTRTDPADEKLIYCYNHVESLLQTGPTCGLVCLVQAKRFIHTESLNLGHLLEEAKRIGLTNSGEMFSGELMIPQ